MHTHTHTFNLKSAMKVFQPFKYLTFQSSNDKWLQWMYFTHNSCLSHFNTHTFSSGKRKHVSCSNATHWTWIHTYDLDGPEQWVKLHLTKTNFESYIQITINTILFWIVNESSMCVRVCAWMTRSWWHHYSFHQMYLIYTLYTVLYLCDFSNLHLKRRQDKKKIPYSYSFICMDILSIQH